MSAITTRGWGGNPITTMGWGQGISARVRRAFKRFVLFIERVVRRDLER